MGCAASDSSQKKPEQEMFPGSGLFSASHSSGTSSHHLVALLWPFRSTAFFLQGCVLAGLKRFAEGMILKIEHLSRNSLQPEVEEDFRPL
jgi:hypothetical protein